MATPAVARLRCEDRTDPVGLGVSAPRFSWEFRSARRGARQRAYRVLVVEASTGRTRWDSGRAVSERTLGVVYGGRPLAAHAACRWRVQVEDDLGAASGWSSWAAFSLGPLTNRDWAGAWIGHPVGGLTAAPFLRKTFRLRAGLRRAVLYATARGLIVPTLDGRPVGDEALEPGWTDYAIRIHYRTWDVTKRLAGRRNATLGAVLGQGWYKGQVGWTGKAGLYGGHVMGLMNLRLEYAGGRVETIATDASWEAGTGPVLEDSLLHGESCDARIRPGGWRPVATSAIEAAPRLLAHPSEPIRAVETLAPVAVRARAGGWIADFGRNIAGRVRLTVRGRRGTVLRLRFAEALNPDGSLYTDNLRTARCVDTYVLRGGGAETWEPAFTFHGFRYCEVAGWPGRPGRSALAARVLSSDLERVGRFACSDPLVNRLVENAVTTQRANFLDVPTDCPQRDERLGWTGDAQVFMPTALFTLDAGAFFAKWLVDLDDAAHPDGAYTNVAPRGPLPDKADAGWGDAGVVCPAVFHRFRDDERLLARQYPGMRRWVEYLARHSRGGLRRAEDGANCFGDWLSLNADTPLGVIKTAYFAKAADLAAGAADTLGRRAEARRYAALASRARAAFVRNFVKPDGRIAGGTQTGYVLALDLDLLPERLRPRAAAHLVADLTRRGWHLSTGFLGAPRLLHVLERFGRLDAAYRVLRQRTYPSWLYPVTQGATSVWERWNGWTKQQGFADANMNSFSHYAYGSVVDWLFSVAAGIRPLAPGFATVEIRPRPGGGLTHAGASYRSVRGEIACAWRITGDALALSVTVPANVRAIIVVPADDPTAVAEGGVPIDRAPGLTVLRRAPGAVTVAAGGGRYAFASLWKNG